MADTTTTTATATATASADAAADTSVDTSVDITSVDAGAADSGHDNDGNDGGAVAPRSTADIARSLDAGSDDDGDGDGTSVAVSDETAADAGASTVDGNTTAKADDTTEPSEAEKLLTEAGISAKGTNGRENRIPYSKVQRIITNQLAKERQAFESSQAEVTQKVQQYEATLGDMAGVESLMLSQDPREAAAFLRGLMSVNPVYAQLLVGEADTDANTPAASRSGAPSRVAPNAERPKPNAQLADGTLTYDLDGIQSLLDWHAGQVEARIEQRIGQRVKPFEDEAEQRRQAQIETDRLERSRAKVSNDLEDAKTWPGFMEHHKEILADLQADSAEAARTGKPRKLTLESAYRQRVVPKLIASQTEMRSTLLAEIQKQPRSTSAGSTTGSTTRQTNAVRSTADIARELDRSGQ